MKFALRLLLYVAGGGALLAWINPRNSVAEAVLILMWIAVCAAVDTAVKAVTMGRAKPEIRRKSRPFRVSRPSGAKGPFGLRLADPHDRGERRSLRLLHATASLEEAELLLAQLRERKLHPMLVTQRKADEVAYEVRLPEGEWTRGHAVMARFATRIAES